MYEINVEYAGHLYLVIFSGIRKHNEVRGLDILNVWEVVDDGDESLRNFNDLSLGAQDAIELCATEYLLAFSQGA